MTLSFLFRKLSKALCTLIVFSNVFSENGWSLSAFLFRFLAFFLSIVLYNSPFCETDEPLLLFV